MKSLPDIHAYWIEHCACELKNTATQAVPGNGNPHAEVVFIGEAPGKKEDMEGTPFIGAAGKFLSEMLASINMNREDIYITNVVKYRPPNNRDPLPSEKAACRPWLEEELQAIKPKLVVFLGRHAMSNFFPEKKISAVHGKLLQKHIEGMSTSYFLPLYHPAAALYNGGLRAQLLRTLRQFQKY
ncbi:MAG: uracil-DNA glycosylase [Patescibacteria group bacterium]